MSDQLSFDWAGVEDGRHKRDAAVEQVEQGSQLAFEALYVVAVEVARVSASSGVEFTTDDVWSVAKLNVREPRVMGAVMTRLRKEGLAMPLHRTRPAHRGVNHARPQRLWAGL